VLILTGSGKIFAGRQIRSMASQGRSMEPPAPSVREELHPHEADIRKMVPNGQAVDRR
jgi:hypothetical protein